MLVRRVIFELERRLAPARLGRLRAIEYAGGLRMEVDLSRPKERTPYLLGLPEYATATTFMELLQPGMNVVDAGANMGEYTLLAAAGVGAAGRVLAVEPNPLALERLRRNLELNQLDQVSVAACALGRSSGLSTLAFDPADTRTGRLLEPGALPGSFASEAVAVRRLGDLLRELGWERVDVVKLDVEGAEADVLEGAADFIDASRPKILFEVNGVTSSADGYGAPAITWLRRRRYRLFSLTMEGARPHRRELEVGADPRLFGEPGSATNLLALPG